MISDINISEGIAGTPRMLRLTNAIICIECEHVFNIYDIEISAKITCPKCTNSVVYPLATFLNRKQ